MKIQEFDFSVNLLQSLLWQHNKAEKLESLLTKKNEWYIENQTQFWTDWYNNVFNLLTANEFGLTVWAIILNIPIFLDLNPDPDGKPIFGFNENPPINDYVNFENGNFSNRDQTVVLSVEEQRLILRLRYYNLVSRGAIPETNRFLKELFKDFGAAYVLDGLDMTITYVFDFEISNPLLYILQYYDVLPRPAGVKVKYIILPRYIFGFGADDDSPNNFTNFENGCLVSELISTG